MKEIRLCWFDMNTPGHHNYGLWRHPRNNSYDYSTLDYWVDVAKTLERGKFDALFLADVVGTYDVYGGGAEAALRRAVQVPVNDPVLLLPALALVTEHLGLAATINISNEQPYTAARRMSTLDHLSKGRFSWNIVTGYLDSGSRAVGRTEQISHDERYDVADDFMDAMYKLWESSWDDDAVIRDAENCIYVDPARVRPVVHKGKYYSVDAVHLCEPSPQRTPLLFQAGSSGRGLKFAGRHSECVFVSGSTVDMVAPVVAGVRAAASGQGRDAQDVKVLMSMTVITGRTDEEAQAKYEEYRKYADPVAALVWASGITGVDLAQFDIDEVVDFSGVTGRGVAGAVRLLSGDPNVPTTLRSLGERAAIGSVGALIVGSPARIADELEKWMAQADVDGFNLTRMVAPETLTDFVDLVVPELQRRGIYKREYAEGTLRQKVFGRGAKLHDNHYGARFAANAGAGSSHQDG